MVSLIHTMDTSAAWPENLQHVQSIPKNGRETAHTLAANHMVSDINVQHHILYMHIIYDYIILYIYVDITGTDCVTIANKLLHDLWQLVIKNLSKRMADRSVGRRWNLNKTWIR